VLAVPAAEARPYLMLDADDHGFKALDLAAAPPRDGLAQATLIEAPLAGAPLASGDGKVLAPLVERRLEIDCQKPRWRTLSVAYLDGQEQRLGEGPADGTWRAFAGDELAPAIQAAACRRQFRQQAVSRYLNLGQILANYQAAHARAAPEPESAKDQIARRFRNGH
jgi:hypothetical protein